jgi:DNA mismatch repair ATPase MutL
MEDLFMATTTTATTTTPTAVTVTATTSWIKQHERTVICAMFLAVTLFLGGKFLDREAVKAQANATVATQVAADAKLAAQQAAQQVAQTQAQYQAMLDALQKQNAALAQAVAQRNVVLVQQQAVDKTLSPTQLTQRWAALVPNTQPTVTPTGVAVTTADAQLTVAQLENVPVLTQNLKDQTEIAQNLNQELVGAGKVNNALGNQISALNLQITDDDRACKADVASVKADARKGKLRWFKIGYVSGLVSGLWLGHAVGL